MRHLLRIFAAVLLTSAVSFAEETNEDPNRLLLFKKFYISPVEDNVDGAFNETVHESFRTVFAKNPRFDLVDADSKADALLETKVTKKPDIMEIEIRLRTGAARELFAVDKTTAPNEIESEALRAKFKNLLRTTLRRIPYSGTLTGRDGNQVTLDIGASQGLKEGDAIQISRVDRVKRHPLLKNIVDAQLVPVGSVVLDTVEESIAFGRVQSEIEGEKIQKFYKVTAIEARASEKKTKDENGWSQLSGEPRDDEGTVTEEEDKTRPTLGYLGLGPYLGGFSATSAKDSDTSTFTGGAFQIGVRLNGELWFTKSLFLDMNFAYAGMSYVQTEANLAPELRDLRT